MGEISSEKKLYVDWGKLGTLLSIVLCTTVLAVLGVLTGSTATAVFFTILGYVAGNGRQATRGLPPQPVIGVRRRTTVTEEE